MRLRAGNHGFSTAARAFTLAVIVAASVAQFVSLSHEMTVRHFRCAEHGELTHVASATTGLAVPVEAGRALRPHDGDSADAHEHCGVAFTLGGVPTVSPPAACGELAAPPPTPAPPAPPPARGRDGALAAAPKTSPPRA